MIGATVKAIQWMVRAALAGLLCAPVLAQDPAGPSTSDSMAMVVAGGNAFAFDLYARLAADTPGNLCFSPSSIHTALAMTYAGAAGRTAEQMAATLHYPREKEKLAAAFRDLIQVLNTPRRGPEATPAYELIVANALWRQQGYPLKPQYVELVKRQYGAMVEEVDFITHPAASRRTINDAVATQTRGKISDLVPQRLITPLTRLILTNAIYFKSEWMDPFPKEATRETPFKLSAGTMQSTPMMHREGHYGYFETADLQGLEMPYLHGDLSMVVLLPKRVDGLSALEKTLSARAFAQWVGESRRALVKVSFPRVTFSGQFSLAGPLKALGMPDAFSPAQADFSGMTVGERLQIDAVIHQSLVTVDENGTEASAATAVSMSLTAMPMREEAKVFTADHPFLFLIRHNGTRAILFVGRVTAPEGG